MNDFDTIFGSQLVPNLPDLPIPPFVLSDRPMVPSPMVPTVPKFGAQVPVPILVEVARSPYDLLGEYDMVPSPTVVDCFPIARTMDTITFCCDGFTV